MQLNVGDLVGQINQTSSGEWELYEDKINKITITKKYGRRYFTRSVFYPLDADDVDNNTKDMEESIGQGYILTKEVFGLNEKTRPVRRSGYRGHETGERLLCGSVSLHWGDRL